jgi:RNA polymerase-binding transcription factor DksA
MRTSSVPTSGKRTRTATKLVDTLTPIELSTLESLIERDLKRALRVLETSRAEATRDVAAGGDLIDRTQAAASRERAGESASRETTRVRELEESLRLLRLSPEQYASCADCGAHIGYFRLEALPTTRFCKDHARGAARGAFSEVLTRLGAGVPDRVGWVRTRAEAISLPVRHTPYYRLLRADFPS